MVIIEKIFTFNSYKKNLLELDNKGYISMNGNVNKYLSDGQTYYQSNKLVENFVDALSKFKEIISINIIGGVHSTGNGHYLGIEYDYQYQKQGNAHLYIKYKPNEKTFRVFFK